MNHTVKQSFLSLTNTHSWLRGLDVDSTRARFRSSPSILFLFDVLSCDKSVIFFVKINQFQSFCFREMWSWKLLLCHKSKKNNTKPDCDWFVLHVSNFRRFWLQVIFIYPLGNLLVHCYEMGHHSVVFNDIFILAVTNLPLQLTPPWGVGPQHILLLSWTKPAFWTQALASGQ